MNIGPYQHELPPRRELLENGTVLLTVPVSSAHSISLGVWLRRGSQDEPHGLGGLAHFLEHIVFRGSRNREAFAIAQLFDSLGASVDAYTTKDHVAFILKVLPEYFAPAAAGLADMVLNPAFDPDLVRLEQEIVCEEIQEARDTPEDLLHDAFSALVYGDHPRSRPILGSPATVNAFTPGLLAREHTALFSGPDLVVSAAGNVDGDTTDILRACFGPAVVSGQAPPAPPAPGDAPFAAVDDVLAEADIRDGRLFIESPVQQSYFEIGNAGVHYDHADRVPLVLLSSILGGGMSSRIFQAVREREGLAYSVYNYTDMGRDVGLVSCAGSCSPGKLERVEAVIRAEYLTLAREGVGEQELEDNRAQIKSQLIFSLEGSTNQMGRAAKDEIYYGRFQSVRDLVRQVDAVDRDDIARCITLYHDVDRLLTAVHGPGS
jgi:predicted Zn-dependent peptidase